MRSTVAPWVFTPARVESYMYCEQEQLVDWNPALNVPNTEMSRLRPARIPPTSARIEPTSADSIHHP